MKLQFTPQDLQGSYIPTEGNFVVRIKSVTIGTSHKGDQKLILEFLGLGDVAGKSARNDISLNQNAKFRVRDLYLAAGFSSEQLIEGVDHSELVGKVILLKRKPKNYTTSDGSEKQGSSDYYQKPSDALLAELGTTFETSSEEDVPF